MHTKELYQRCMIKRRMYNSAGEIGQILVATIELIENHHMRDIDTPVSGAPTGIPEWVDEKLMQLKSRLDDMEDRMQDIESPPNEG